MTHISCRARDVVYEIVDQSVKEAKIAGFLDVCRLSNMLRALDADQGSEVGRNPKDLVQDDRRV